VNLSIFISVFNQLDAQNLFHNKFYFTPQHVSSTMCSSSGGQNRITQPLVSSHPKNSHINFTTICSYL